MNDTQNTSDPIQDAEYVVEGDTFSETNAESQDIKQTEPQSSGNVIIDLENLIKSHISGLDVRRDELKKLREIMASAFKNDPTYQQAEEEVKEANKQKKNAKARLMQLPEVSAVAQKVKDLAVEVKDMDMALSDYLREYQRLSGSNEIIDDQGRVHEIVYIAKLLKK